MTPLLFAVACAPKVDETALVATGTPGASDAAVLATVSEDYSVGALATVDLETWAVADTLTDISGDPAVVVSGGYVFQLDRFGYDTVRVYTPGAFSEPIAEFALEDLANPHDVVVCDGLAFLSAYGGAELAVHDPRTGHREGGVDLSAFDDGDGSPEPSRLVLAPNGKVYAGLHQFDQGKGWVATGGTIVEVDCATRAVTNSWAAPTPDVYDNPGAPSNVLVHSASTGFYLLDTDSGALSDLLLADATIGASVDGVAAWGDGAVVTTFDDAYGYAVGCVDLTAWTYAEAERSPNYLTGIAANDRGEVWIGARTHWATPGAPNGALVYDGASCEARTDAPITTLLAPFSVAFY